MPELRAGPYRFRLQVQEVLGDIGDRSLAGLRYLVKLGFRDASDLCLLGFSTADPSKIRTDGTRVTDEAPDRFHQCFSRPLVNGDVAGHRTVDRRLSIGVYPAKACTGLDWHDLPCEPIDFVGDPENVFKVVACVNPFKMDCPGIPWGGGVAVVMPVYRKDIETFLSSWLREINEAPKSKAFGRHPYASDLLRWMPRTETTEPEGGAYR